MTRLEKTCKDKHASLFGLLVSDEEKKIHEVDPSSQCYETFFFCHWQRLLVIVKHFEPSLIKFLIKATWLEILAKDKHYSLFGHLAEAEKF
jgi:hypothetical protein